MQRASATSQLLKNDHRVSLLKLTDLDSFLIPANRQIDQIRSQVLTR